MPRGVAATLAILAVAAGTAGCGRTPVLDVTGAEADIRARLDETYAVDVDEVACPPDIEVDEGETFRCTARAGDLLVQVDVVQADEGGTLEVTARQALLSTPVVEADIATTLADDFDRDDVEVSCEGPDVRVEEPEATFTCEAVDGDETKEVTVRVRDALGALAYSLAD